ncbi:glycosyltransferase family 4 protein [Patescibacteria group bacterium]|nr:glycosyltransferase family 4 protein [Patescibacteria group bacterium]
MKKSTKTLAKRRLLVTRFPLEARMGGEEVHTFTLMERLRGRGYKTYFLGSCPVLLFGEWDGKRRAWLGKPPVTKIWLVLFTVMSPVLFILSGFYLWRARRKWKVDTLYCLSFGEKLMMTPWGRIFGMKVLWLEHARIGRWLRGNPWRIWYSFLSRFVTVVVTSRAMKEKVPAKNVVATSCGVELEKSRPLRKEILSFLKGGFGVGTVCRLTVDKGVDKIVRLVDTEPDMRLVLVGSGPLLSAIESSKNRDRILHVDSLARGELTSLYKALDVFILGSTEFDPFGMVAAEAMMAGTATVVTRECGISFDLKNGREAMVVGAGFAEMDKAVRKLRDSRLREKIGKAGKKFAKEHYSIERMVEEFVRLLE